MRKNDLKEKLKELTSLGYIKEEQLERIEREYFIEESKGNKLLLIFALFGVLFIGIGVISIFAFNWSYFSRGVRVILAITPLIFVQCLLYFKWCKGASKVWIQSLTLGIGIAFLFAIGLIYQTYQLSFSLTSILLLTFLLMLPVIYIFDAYYLAILCLFGVIFFSLDTNKYYTLLVGLIVPYYRTYLKKDKDKAYTLTIGMMAWIAELIGLLPNTGSDMLPLTYIFLLILFTRINLNSLYRIVGLIGFYVISFMVLIVNKPCSLSGYWQIGTSALLGIVLLYFVCKERDKAKNIETGIFLIQPILCVLWGNSSWDFAFGVLFNVYIVGMITYLIVNGVWHKAMHKVRSGVFLLSVYALIKVFSLESDLLLKGVGFILAGMLFLGANLWITKRFGGNEDEKQ